MSFAIAAFCFLTAVVAYFLAWCFGDSSLAAFTIPCALNGWDRAEKAASIRRAAIYYTIIGIGCLVKGALDHCRQNSGEIGNTTLRYGAGEDRSSYVPLVSRLKGSVPRRGYDEEREPLVSSNSYGGTDVEMRRILPK